LPIASRIESTRRSSSILRRKTHGRGYRRLRPPDEGAGRKFCGRMATSPA
jgi:hypothetical protein